MIEQSVASYELLLSLLERASRLASAATERERELYLFAFDGFAKILLNNMNALYQSEKCYLDIVFELRNKASTSASQFVQTEYYPKLLKLLIWRT